MEHFLFNFHYTYSFLRMETSALSLATFVGKWKVVSLSLSRYKLDSRFITRGWIVVFDEIVGTVVWIGV